MDAKYIIFSYVLLAAFSIGEAQEPEITEKILPEIKPIGTTGRLNCTVINQLDNTVTWMHLIDPPMHISKDDKIEIDEKLNIIEYGLRKYQVFKMVLGDKVTYQLVVSRLERRDAGTYRCQINVIGDNSRIPTKDGKMVVLIPPSVIKSATTNAMTRHQGESANLTCAADGYPKPNITWVRVNGGLLPNGKLRQQGSMLYIKSVGTQDRGIFRCLADNAVRPPAVFDVNLYTTFKPVARAIQSSYGQAENRMFDVTIECRIAGWPEPDLRWYQVGKGGSRIPMKMDDKHTINILLNHANILDQQERWFQMVIRAVQANDFGDYICEGKNSLGVSEGWINLFATSECQGPNCPEEQRPEKSAATSGVTSSVLMICLSYLFSVLQS